MAEIQLILGSMFSGKSTELIRRCRTYKAINKNVLIINHINDTRCNNEIQTHDKNKFKAFKANTLCDININDYNVIGIDESQFFADLVDFIKKYEHTSKTILIAGLDGDYNRNKFGETLDIIPYCNSVSKLSAMCAICKDGTLGIFSKRLHTNDDKVFIGSSNEYAAVCRKCFLS